MLKKLLGSICFVGFCFVGFIVWASLSSLSDKEIVAIKERAIAGHATEADKRQLINQLTPNEQKWLLNLDVLSGTSAPIALRNFVKTEDRSPSEYKLAIIDALIEIYKPPGQDPYERGLKHLADKQYDLAIQEFDRAISVGKLDSYYGRGQAWLAKQDYKRAIADFTEGIKNSGRDYFAYVQRAEAYAGDGDRENAIADYRRALTFDPDESTKKQIKRCSQKPQRQAIRTLGARYSALTHGS